MYRRTVNYTTVADGETGPMPRALDDLFLKLAFGQRAAEVRARFGKGVYLRATPNQQNRSSIMIDPNVFFVRQIRFLQHWRELVR